MKCLDGSCNKIITIGLPYCSNHMQQYKKLIIKQIKDIKGKGVFAYDHLKKIMILYFIKIKKLWIIMVKILIMMN